VILYYHRVAAPRLNPWRTAVSPQAFERQLDFLAAETRVLPLAELVAAYRRGSIPERAVAITFDDGYVDNLEQALPRLRSRGLPATFYVATGLLDRPGPPWWDEVADLLLGPGERPPRLELRLGRRRLRLPTATVAEREDALFSALNPGLRNLAPERIEAALEPLRAWADRDPAEPPVSADGISEPRLMTSAELARLAADDLAELGAHTALHPDLPNLPLEQQRREILASRERLAEFGAPPRSFAYPYGANSARTRRAVREAGFDHAVGVQEFMPLTTAARELELPRVMPFEESGEELERRLAAVLAGAGG